MPRSLSLYLDSLRFLAALAVYLFHAQYFAKVSVPLVGDLGNEAVIVFFVLSGLLISDSGRREPRLAAFVQARLTRLWSVCLPALALTVCCDLAGQYLSLASYHPMQPFTPFKWAAALGINALFLNQIWHVSIYPGTNGPFWSMSYEFWYYMLFAALYYLKGYRRLWALVTGVLIAGPTILTAFPSWLFGAALCAAVARTPGDAASKGSGIGWICWGGSLAVALACAALGVQDWLKILFAHSAAAARWPVDFWPFSYLVGLLVALNIYGAARLGERLLPLMEKCRAPIRWGAGISFGLYLFHYPLMYLCRAVLHALDVSSGAGFVAAMYLIPFAVAVSLALLCERNKSFYARRIGSLFDFALRRHPQV